MSELTKCDLCLEIVRCDDFDGRMLCDECTFHAQDNEMSDENMESLMNDSDLEAQYLESIDNPFQLEVMDDEQYVSPPEQEFDDFDLGSCEDYYDDSMDGDHESAFGSIGWGVDEYYDHGDFGYDDGF